MSDHKLLVLPDDTIKPILSAIAAAMHSIRIKMFIFNEPLLLEAVMHAKRRGVEVRVLLNPSRSNGEAPNVESKKALQSAGIEVRDTPPAFKVSHEKSLVIDGRLAIVQTLNWTARHLSDTRDYAILTTDPAEVAEIVDCFECDWVMQPYPVTENAKLIWCRGNGRVRIARFIDSAQHSLYIQNDRYHDLVVLERLLKAQRRGVKIHIMSPPLQALKREKLSEGVGALKILHDAGIKVHSIPHLALHAKALLADNRRAVIGSINLTPGSFDDRRELAIEVKETHLIERLQFIMHSDWHQSNPINLSDHSLYEQLALQEEAYGVKVAADPLFRQHSF